MASALPVIGTDAAGTPEIITAERNGLLVPPADPAALAAAIASLVRDPARRVRLGAQARVDSARFSHVRQCEAVEDLLRTLAP
jgi:glycosyltransferase involved in cell wall biosynthesis